MKGVQRAVELEIRGGGVWGDQEQIHQDHSWIHIGAMGDEEWNQQQWKSTGMQTEPLILPTHPPPPHYHHPHPTVF